MCRVEEYHASKVKGLTGETEDQRSQMTQMEREINYLRTELDAQKEANVRSPSNTMKNLVERLKAQLSQKEKQLKVVVCVLSLFFDGDRRGWSRYVFALSVHCVYVNSDNSEMPGGID